MAIRSIDYKLLSPSASLTQDGAIVIRANARIKMDASDGIVAAMNAANLPQQDDTYNLFGETYNGVTLRDLEFGTVIKTPEQSEVDCVLTYVRDPINPQEPTGSGGRTDDPENVQPILTPGYRFVSKPVFTGIFWGVYEGDGTELDPTDNTKPGWRVTGIPVPISNASGVPIEPTPEEMFPVPTLTLEKYYRKWDNAFDDAVLKTNDDEFRIIFPDDSGVVVYDRTFDIEELLLQNITATQRQFGSEIWYWLKFEFWIGDFYLEFPNMGLTQLVPVPGSPSTFMRVPIQTTNGQLLPEPVQLDQYGQEAAQNANANFTRWYFRDSYDFNLLGLFD